MLSLRQLLVRHSPVLLVDAASVQVQVGWITRDGTTRWATSNEEAGVGVFRCLEQLSAQPDEAAAFVFCDGPGSILGVRTVATAVRTWSVLSPRPAFAYHSLSVVAAALNEPAALVIADARRDSWHGLSLGGKLRRIPTAELAGPLVTPDGFRNWTPLPAGVRHMPYILADLLPRTADIGLFRETDAPDAFLHEEPSYVTWTPQVHRAP